MVHALWMQNTPISGNTSKDGYKLWLCHKGHWTVNYEIFGLKFQNEVFLVYKKKKVVESTNYHTVLNNGVYKQAPL